MLIKHQEGYKNVRISKHETHVEIDTNTAPVSYTHLGSGSDSTTGSGSGDKENPSSGDHSMIPGALAVLALSAAGVVVLTRKKK